MEEPSGKGRDEAREGKQREEGGYVGVALTY